MHSDTPILDSATTGMSHPTVTEFATPEGAASSSKSAALASVSPQSEVGESRHGVADPKLTDGDREDCIRRAGAAMQGWYSRYQHTGDPAALDRAYHCLGLMRSLIAGRSPAQVARMEAERGLDLPACANEGAV